MAISSPQPSVLHLVTLFRQITAGDIKIPAFQREFVWQEKQMIELLESVAEGFPIGSVLLWGVDSKMLKLAPSDGTSFPTVAEHYPAAYVLDGMQRLSTLYGAFHHGVSTRDPRFDILYDLETGFFSHRANGEAKLDKSIPLSALFTPRQLLEHQARLGALPDGDALIEKLLLLQAAFQEYMIPVVTIRSNDIRRIVGIFEKINSTGTKLDPVDFMRAITWAEDFDLNHYIDNSSAELAELGIDVSPETIIKCVGLTLQVPPTTDGLLTLRNRSPKELMGAFRSTIDCMRRVSTFLEFQFNIRSSDFVPYEGQLLLLFKSIGMEDVVEADEEARIVRWFWATGFNESLRGKPDHYVVRAVENWRGLVRGAVRGLEPRLKLSEIELFERRLVAGGALSTTFATMHAATEARSLINGSVIEPAMYMTHSDVSWFEPVFTRPELVAGGLPHAISARMFGNVVLVDRAQLKKQAGSLRDSITQAAKDAHWDVLASQFINEEAVAALEVQDVRAFMKSRVGLMHDMARVLVE
jgi:hypothetical protein